MKLERIGGTAATIVQHESDGRVVLYSYSTPVAIYYPSVHEIQVTQKKFSVTTSKHINAFVKEHGRAEVELVPQEDIEKFA